MITFWSGNRQRSSMIFIMYQNEWKFLRGKNATGMRFAWRLLYICCCCFRCARNDVGDFVVRCGARMYVLSISGDPLGEIPLFGVPCTCGTRKPFQPCTGQHNRIMPNAAVHRNILLHNNAFGITVMKTRKNTLVVAGCRRAVIISYNIVLVIIITFQRLYQLF